MAIRHKRKALADYTWLNTDLVDGQVGVNTVDGTLHVLKTDNSVFEIAYDKSVWKGPWVDSSYQYNEMTRDGDWTMICSNPAGTLERPAPTPIGSPEDSIDRDINFSETNYIGIVEMYHEFTLAQSGWLTELYIKVPEFNTDTIARVTVTNVTKGISSVMNSVILTAEAWTPLALDWRPVGVGVDFIIKFEIYNSTGASDVIGRWDSNEGTGSPANEEFKMNNFVSPSTINIDHNDRSGANRSTALDGIPIGSILLINETGSLDRNVKVRIDAVDTAPLLYTGYTVSVISNGDKNIRDGKECTLTFDLPISQPTRYYDALDYYLGATNQPAFANFTTKLYYDGVLQADVDDAYGIGIIFQEAYVSPDWQLISISGASATGAQAATVTIVDNLTSTDANAALSANMGRELNVTKSDINHTHALPDLTDVILTTPVLDDVLTYNGTDWINKAFPVAQKDFPSITLGVPANVAITTTFTNIDWGTNVLVQNDTTIIEHDPVNTTRVLIKESGLYFLAFSVSFDADAGEEQIRVRALTNDLTLIPGSERLASEDDEINDLSNSITCELIAGDYVTLQVQATGAGNVLESTTTFMMTRASSVKGDVGPAGPPGTFKDSFAGHNSATTQTFTTTITNNFATNVRNDGAYTHNTVVGGSEITINTAGWYRVAHTVSINNTSNTRSTASSSIEVNGVLVSGSKAYSYHRNNNDGFDSSSKTMLLNLAVNDVVRVRSTSNDGQTLVTVADGCNITIEAID